ncbi:MAG: phenylalanine--tRNA ligase subunit beta [Candidatus Omnitrophica bacterium]|nr:phenylalanine--tRNA ligase subunit beta [Candidatus Omnitrophota bacterium]
MRISYNWLKDYINLNLAPEKLEDVLTMSGLTTESILHKSGNDCILEIEVTANRPDWLSYIGVARELSAITGNKLKVPVVPKIKPSKEKAGIKISIEEKNLCPRYTARIIKNVKIADSPDMLKKKLDAMNLRPVNNVVDITNFCLFETGEPMHAFDLDKIQGGEIIVRKARKGEKIITIDGVERTLADSMLVIADKVKAIAIAGVMGGINTEVTAATKNILLEAASFDQISVRRTARSLGISTDSSYRFERKVDINNIEHSSDRAATLIKDLARGEICNFIDIGRGAPSTKAITLRLAKLEATLGLEIPSVAVKRILNSLGLTIKRSSKKAITAQPPPFRYDLNNEIDIIEEIARIYGYNKIPNTIPNIVEQAKKIPLEVVIEKQTRTILTGLGADEIITYSLLGKNALSGLGIADNTVAEIKNPLSNEQEIMRPNLVPGMLSSMLWNINRKSKDLKLFEIGRIYLKGSEAKFSEKKHLAIGITGEKANWAEGARQCNFFDLKGMAETLLASLGITNTAFKYAANDIYSRSCSASVDIEGENIGTMGEVSRKISNNFDIKETVYFCELSLDAILKYADLEKRFSELPKYPSVHRDMSLLVPKDVLNSDLAAAVKNTAGAILKEIKLIDRYAGKQIPDGKLSLTYRLEYADPSKTLEEKDVTLVHSNILRTLEEKFGARLR